MQYCGSKVNAKQNKCGTDNTSDFIVDSFTTTKCKKKGGGFPGGSDSKESACNARDLGSTLGLGRSPGQGMATHSSILALGIPMDSGAWKATVHGWQRVGHD